jgi:hypothetical protein
MSNTTTIRTEQAVTEGVVRVSVSMTIKSRQRRASSCPSAESPGRNRFERRCVARSVR